MTYLEDMRSWFLLSPFLLVIFHFVPLPATAAVSDMAHPLPIPAKRLGCATMCGNVHIPYPFGIGDECSWKGEFTVTCNQSFSPPRPYSGDFEIISISLVAGEIRLFSPVAYICKNPANSNQSSGEVNWTFTFTNSSFLISPTHNVFMAIGCDTLAFVDGREDESFFTGCITTCKSLHDAAQDGDECTGLGCCQTGIPGNLSTISIYWSVDKNDSLTNPTWSPCSYAFVSEKGWYKFKRRDLTRVGNKSFTDRVGDRTIPMVLDWALRNEGSCQLPAEDGKSSPKPTPSACASANSYCVNATQRHGYLCHCSKGYGGNPYIEGGCININECELRKSNPAKYGKLYPCHSASTCQDTPGDYKCKCNFWHRGNGKSDKGCQPIVPGYGVAIVATFVAVVLACFAGVLLQRREHRKNFSKNGGDLLQEAGINTFTKGDLEKITNRYKKKIGQGHFGQVYEGTIKGTQRVAVKRPHEKGLKGAAVPVEEFRNEIIFQFRISHENLVRLVGCCLETDVPILVFEYISRGSLQEVLHGGKPPCPLSLTERLDIAIGSAKALAHMHLHGEHNHVHGDVKPANILLDGDLKPKVSDFGSSKLLSVNSYARHVAADGTYIDPVYYNTGRFTVKSDVYSFGVVLLELITRRMARHGDNILTLDFKNSCKAYGNGREMYDPEILSDDDTESSQCYMECLDMVGALAIRCLNGDDAEERPTMGEVVVELEQAKSVANRGSCKEAS